MNTEKKRHYNTAVDCHEALQPQKRIRSFVTKAVHNFIRVLKETKAPKHNKHV